MLHSVEFYNYTGISDLGCIEECIGLEKLDISDNNITELHTLASLSRLQTLNVSSNRVCSLGMWCLYLIMNYIDTSKYSYLFVICNCKLIVFARHIYLYNIGINKLFSIRDFSCPLLEFSFCLKDEKFTNDKHIFSY